MEYTYFIQPSPVMNRLREACLRSGTYSLAVKTGFTIRLEDEVRPGFIAPVIASNRNSEPRIFPMKWGIPLPARKGTALTATVNGKTIRENPILLDLWKSRRCIIPASWYYGSTTVRNTTTKYSIHLMKPGTLWLAGLYCASGGIPAFVLLTVDEPSFFLGEHPIVLEKNAIREWIHPSGNPREIILNNTIRQFTWLNSEVCTYG